MTAKTTRRVPDDRPEGREATVVAGHGGDPRERSVPGQGGQRRQGLHVPVVPSRREREPRMMLGVCRQEGQDKVRSGPGALQCCGPQPDQMRWNRRIHKSKRQPVVELPRLRLPLPERTGSDRDELRCPHGFVDRAYSVFLLRCVATNRTHLLLRTCVCPSPPL